MSDTDDVDREAFDPAAFDYNSYNRSVIEEFRATRGSPGGQMANAPLLLLNHRGAKSGRHYTSPLVYTRDGEDYVVIASKGGAPANPHWFLNLVAHPDVTIEVGSETLEMTARVAEGEERARLFAAQAAVMANFDDYAKATTREIPVVVLRRR